MLGILSLVLGVWGGLIRVPLNLPFPTENANWITFHGPLMVCGFLGTVIGLERAVGLGKWWTYGAPLLTGAGALLLIVGVLGKKGETLLTLGSVVFVLAAAEVVRLRRELFTVVMGLGAVTWLTGNLLWLWDWPIHRVVPWWMGFLALTILGERLDLSRFQKQVRSARPLLWVALGVFLAGVVWSAFAQRLGERLLGLGLLAMALWLGRFDIARRTIRQAGLTRYMAVCLLSGYVWLAGAGILFWLRAPLEYGSSYDAALHAFFLGFVFLMIFGHAPVIFPSVLLLPINFRPVFYVHVVVLQGALLLRLAGDLGGWPGLRQLGSMGNGIALALFLANTIWSFLGPWLGGAGRRERSLGGPLDKPAGGG